MYGSSASHGCEVQDDFLLEKLKGWRTPSSYTPLLTPMQERNANPSCPRHAPTPLPRLALNLPVGSPWERHGNKRYTVLLQKFDCAK